MSKLNFLTRPAVYISGIVVLVGIVLGLSWMLTRPAPFAEGSFSLVEDPATLVWSIPLEELNVDPKAVEIFQSRIDDFEQRIAAGIENEQTRRDAYLDLGLNYTYLGRYQDAYETYLKAFDLNPENRIVLMQLGDVLVRMKGYASAEKAYRLGIDVNPYPEQTYVKIADARAKAGRPADEILEIYDWGLSIAEKPIALYQGKAELLVKLGKYDEAIDAYEAMKENVEDTTAIEAEIAKLQKKNEQ